MRGNLRIGRRILGGLGVAVLCGGMFIGQAATSTPARAASGSASPLAVSLNTLDFGRVQLRHSSPVQTIVVSNTDAQAAAALNAFFLPDRKEYHEFVLSLASTCYAYFGGAAAGSLIPAHGTCTIGVTFRPQKMGRRTTQLMINTGSGQPLLDIKLTGIGGR